MATRFTAQQFAVGFARRQQDPEPRGHGQSGVFAELFR